MKRYGWMVALLLSAGLSFSALGQDADPAEIIRKARQTQDWLTKAQSFHVRFDDGMEVAFDRMRLYQASRSPFGGQSLWYWDGKRAVRNSRENVYEITDSSAALQRSFFTWTTWGRSGQVYWWTENRQRPDDFLGTLYAYEYVGREKFHEIECHVFTSSRPPNRRLYIGVETYFLHGEGWSHTYLDYKEVAPGCWFPMTEIQQTRTRKVVHIAVDTPLPDTLFTAAIPEGAKVIEAAGGTSLEYVYSSNRAEDEAAEMRIDAARRKLFAPPPHPPGASVRLSSPVEPLPLNPLVVNPAPEFPQGAEWMNGGPAKLADLRGKVVLIVFWATWQEFSGGGWGRETSPPNLKTLDPVKDEVRVIGVHIPTKNPAKVALKAKELGLEFPICIDVSTEAGWGVMAEKYRLDESPAVYVIDRTGMVAAYGSWNVAVRRAGELLGTPLPVQP